MASVCVSANTDAILLFSINPGNHPGQICINSGIHAGEFRVVKRMGYSPVIQKTMSIEKQLQKRTSACELCGSDGALAVYTIPPATQESEKDSVYICSNCSGQIEVPETMDANHWRCLNDSMWSTFPAVQVMAWRILNRLKAEGWPQDLLDMLYLDEETQAWAEATGEGVDPDDVVKHLDSNGAVLQAGDTVVLIKDLNVKGGGFTAKRGTAVRNISLVHDNPEHIEGKVNGQHIVILTQFVKKS